MPKYKPEQHDPAGIGNAPAVAFIMEAGKVIVPIAERHIALNTGT
jgi:hypothetical protein